jgi:hypothetical protein
MLFIRSVAVNYDVALEVRKIPELPNEYMVDMCGYSGRASDHASVGPKLSK